MVWKRSAWLYKCAKVVIPTLVRHSYIHDAENNYLIKNNPITYLILSYPILYRDGGPAPDQRSVCGNRTQHALVPRPRREAGGRRGRRGSWRMSSATSGFHRWWHLSAISFGVRLAGTRGRILSCSKGSDLKLKVGQGWRNHLRGRLSNQFGVRRLPAFQASRARTLLRNSTRAASKTKTGKEGAVITSRDMVHRAPFGLHVY